MSTQFSPQVLAGFFSSLFQFLGFLQDVPSHAFSIFFLSFPNQEHVLCLPSHSGHGRREIVEETDLSVLRRLGNPVADRGHHVAPGGRGFG